MIHEAAEQLVAQFTDRHHRNAEMVNLGADVMLAFPLGQSAGTGGCMRLAEAGGIPVRVYEQRDAVVT